MEEKYFAIDGHPPGLFSCQSTGDSGGDVTSYMLPSDACEGADCKDLLMCSPELPMPSPETLALSQQGSETNNAHMLYLGDPPQTAGSCLDMTERTSSLDCSYSVDRTPSLESYLSMLDSKYDIDASQDSATSDPSESALSLPPMTSSSCLQLSSDVVHALLSGNSSTISSTTPCRGQLVNFVLMNNVPMADTATVNNLTTLAINPLANLESQVFTQEEIGKDTCFQQSYLPSSNHLKGASCSGDNNLHWRTLSNQKPTVASFSPKLTNKASPQPMNKSSKPFVKVTKTRRATPIVDSREKKFACNVCDKKYFTASHLKAHQRSHTDEKPYSCDMCSNTYRRPESLSAHRRIHQGIKRFECSTCGKQYGYYSHLNVHIKKVHKNLRPFECEDCGKTFTMRNNLRYHMKIHSKEKPHKCELCGRGFTYAADLQRHRRGHTGERNYICDICGKAFSESGAMTRHRKQVHHPGRTDTVVKTSKSRTAEILSPNDSNEEGTLASLDISSFINLSCGTCSRSFNQEADLIDHVMSEHKSAVLDAALFKCSLCPWTFDSLHSVKAYENLMHLLEKKQLEIHKCDICKVSCPTKRALVAHKAQHYTLDDNTNYTDISLCHKENGQFQCNYCSRQFTYQAGLVVHRFSHSKTRPYHCTQSGHSFKTRHYLYCHMERCKHNLNATPLVTTDVST